MMSGRLVLLMPFVLLVAGVHLADGFSLNERSEESPDVVEEADAFLDRLRTLWKSAGEGNRANEETERPVLVKWPNRETHRRQLKVPVRLGLVRFSSRKPTALPKVSSASSFPVLMPSEPSVVRAFNFSEDQLALYRLSRRAQVSLAKNLIRRYHRTKRSDYYPEFQGLPVNQDTEHPLDMDGDKWSDYFSGPEVAHDVCPSVSDWVARSEALDPYGNRLTVLQRIPVNGTVVNQYFFETYCAPAGLEGATGHSFHSGYYTPGALVECRGINKNLWNSRCKENFIWTYGKVITISGDIGWSVIAIRGSCGCAIWRKPPDLVGRRRSLMRKPFLTSAAAGRLNPKMGG